MKPKTETSKKPASRKGAVRAVKVGPDGITVDGEAPARAVEIIHPDGRHERVSAFRAARLVTEGSARPGDWNRADLEAVEAADALRKHRQVATLRRDGLLANDGAPGYVAPVPFSALCEMFSSWRFGGQ